MKGTRPRIWGLALAFGAGAMILVVHLYLLTIEQGELWLERSYRNRWAFKDVPTRRGRILDAQGRVLAEDVPVFGLLLHYRDFRRQHPVGTALHGANLMMQSRGISDQWFRFVGGVQGPGQALDALLSMPWSWLWDPDETSEQTAQDLRYYVVSTVSALTGRSWWTVYRGLRDLERPVDAAAVTVGEALRRGGTDVEDLRSAHARSFAELGDLARRLADNSWTRSGGLRTCDLWQVLDRWRAAWTVSPDTERVLRVVERNMSFDLAARIELLGDRHPGFWPRPSVVRRHATVPGRSDLASLQSVLGVVTQLWADDAEEIEVQVDETLDAAVVEDLVPRDPDMPPDLVQALEGDARRKVRLHLAIHGRTGRSGVESAFDQGLAGRPGLRLVERDRHARETGLWSSLDTAPGRDVQLTVDLALQALLEDSLDRRVEPGETGIALVEPRTGDVLALGGRWPVGEETSWKTPATTWSGIGFVGSVAKPFVLLEQLDAMRHGRAHRDPSTFEPCAGSFRVYDLLLHCGAHTAAAGRTGDLALAHSCNVFFFQAARGLELDGVVRAYQRVGWADGPPGHPLPQDEAGVRGISQVGRPHLDAVRTIVERRAIGYGVNASALHVARAYAALATGVLPQLGIVAEARTDRAVPLGVHEDDLELIRDGLRGCVTDGTARQVDGLEELGVLAKTGTAEINRTTGANNAWFAGYLTRDEPTMAFAAVAYDVPDGEHGAEVAGRLVADLLRSIRADPVLRARYLPGVSGR